MTTNKVLQSDGIGITRRHSAQLLLFPLCDARGCVSRALRAPHSESGEQGAENIFFAWLLDLPSGIDASAAADAVLLVNLAESEGYEPAVVDSGAPGFGHQEYFERVTGTKRSATTKRTAPSARLRISREYQKKMIDLLQRVRSTGSLYL